jgi:hypothetical protein
VEIVCGFSSWILIAKTEWKIETQIAGNCFGAQKKSPEVFVQKSNIQLAETTQIVEILCRFAL